MDNKENKKKKVFSVIGLIALSFLLALITAFVSNT